MLVTISTVSSATVLSNKNNVNSSIMNQQVHSLSNWTVMIYLAFDNHRHNEREFTFNMLKEIGSGLDFNLVVLYDGLEQGDTNLFYVEEHMMIPLAWYESESDMGHKDTLKNFIQLTKHLYPSENYALFVSSTHGSGWQGLGCDTFGTGTFKKLSLLNMSDYKDIFKEVTNNGTNKIDVVAYEICTTASIEAAYQISPYANYMIGTEEHGFGPTEYTYEGIPLEWNFSYFLKYLKDNTNISPEEFCKVVVNSYSPGLYIPRIGGIISPPSFYPVVNYKTTMSAVNLSKISLLSNAVKILSDNLSKNIDSSRKEIKLARAETREYGKLYRKYYFLSSRSNFILQLDPTGYDCFIDLYDFAYNMLENSPIKEIADACNDVMQKLENTVIANKVMPEDRSHGLFIYYPQQKIQYDESIWRVIGNPQFRKIPFSYEKLDFSEDTGWNEFLKVYLNI